MLDDGGSMRSRIALDYLSSAATNLGYVVEDLTHASQYLPFAKALVTEAVKKRQLRSADARDLISSLLRDASELQKLRERLERICGALSPLLPPADKGAGDA
ncbi:MAG TPA: hypothetical protein VFZ09_01270 [Archangium sp.]|uniref:hypothetical protein n=1 Tax=Archangium sp. TaxID=1872627 RepID=UPI002E33A46F|nr:hypothetical protein [Archangium sp.]HEX5744839.1 hypothetical protein [Archangium sp.]